MEFSSASDFRTTDAGEAEAHLRGLYGSLELTSDRLRFSQRVRGDATFAITEFEYGGRFEIGGEIDLISVGVADSGFRYEVGSETGWAGSQPVLFQPDQRIVCHVDGVRQRAVTFARAELSRDLGALLATDGDRLRFGSARPRDSARGSAWPGVLAEAARDVVAAPLVRASARSAITRMLVETFPIVGAPIERRAGSLARWAGYRRAVAFIVEHASLPITLSDIASEARLSTSDLDAAFRLHDPQESTALGRLRAVRLDAARRDLLTSDPAGTTVAEVARRWGFPRTAAFAARYRRAFGAWPREALRG